MAQDAILNTAQLYRGGIKGLFTAIQSLCLYIQMLLQRLGFSNGQHMLIIELLWC